MAVILGYASRKPAGFGRAIVEYSVKKKNTSEYILGILSLVNLDTRTDQNHNEMLSITLLIRPC